MFNLILKHDDVTWVLQHKNKTIHEGSFSAVKALMTDAYGFDLKDIHDAVSTMDREDLNFASFGINKRFVFADTINDDRTGKIYHA